MCSIRQHVCCDGRYRHPRNTQARSIKTTERTQQFNRVAMHNTAVVVELDPSPYDCSFFCQQLRVFASESEYLMLTAPKKIETPFEISATKFSVYLCKNCTFFGGACCSSAAEGLFSCFQLRGKQGAHRHITTHVLILAELRGGALSIQRR